MKMEQTNYKKMKRMYEPYAEFDSGYDSVITELDSRRPREIKIEYDHERTVEQLLKRRLE